MKKLLAILLMALFATMFLGCACKQKVKDEAAVEKARQNQEEASEDLNKEEDKRSEEE